MKQEHTRRSKIILSIIVILTLLIIAVWLGLVHQVSYVGTMEVSMTSPGYESMKQPGFMAYSMRGFPVIPAVFANHFRLTENYRAYSFMAIHFPVATCDTSFRMIVHYKGQRFFYDCSEIRQWEKVNRDKKTFYIFPAEVSKLTTFPEKNLALTYILLSSVYWLGLYPYLSTALVPLTLVLLALYAYEFIKRKRKKKNEGVILRPTVLERISRRALLFLFITVSVAHLLLLLFGVVISTTGPVLMSDLFVFIIVAVAILFRKSPEVRKNLILLISVLAGCIISAEIFLRISGTTVTYLEKRNGGFYQSFYKEQEKGWYHVWQPNAVHYLQTSEYCFKRQANSLGLSDREIPVQKSPEEFRVIGIGDSFTEGDGADEDSTWLKFLERSIHQKFRDGNVTLFNTGVCGSDPFFEYVLLRDKLLTYHPDLVIAAFNDEAADIITKGGMERFMQDGTVKYKSPPAWEPLYACSHIFRLIIHKLLHYNYLLLNPLQYESEREAAIRTFIASLSLFKDLADKNNFRLLIILHPSRSEIDENKFVYLDRIKAECERKKIDCLDMLQYYHQVEKIDHNNSSQYFWKNDGHHNAAGYEVFARGVLWKLEKMRYKGFIPPD